MMEIPEGNLFEVTINSNKLYSFMEDISNQIHAQQAKIQELMKTTNIITNQRLKKHQQIIELQLQKIRKSKQQEVNYLKLYIKDVDKKNQQKITSFQGTLGVLNNRIEQMKNSINQDISIKVSYLEKMINSNNEFDKMEEKFDRQILSIRQKIQTIEVKYADVKNQLDMSEQNHCLLLERIGRNELELETQKSLKYIGRQNKRLLSQQHRNGTYIDDQKQIQTIVTKLAQFQQQLSFKKSLTSNNKVVKIHDSINWTKDLAKINGQFQLKVSEELAKIKEYTIERDQQIQKNIWKCNNKYEIINEQLGIFNRKIEKDKLLFLEMKQLIKKSEDNKLNDRLIQGLKQSIVKIEKSFETQLETKLSKDLFEIEKNKIMDRLQIISDLAVEKAQKHEVRKGINFLEQKIKQIILVIAEGANLIKDSATTKTPLKCLSCDKDLDYVQSQTQQAKNLRNSSTNSARCSTNQLRRRVRIKHNSVDQNDF